MSICSSCILTTDFNDNCTIKQAGGNYLKLSIAPACYISSITTIGGTGTDANVISSITLDTANNPSAVWYEVTAKKDTVTITEDLVVPGNFFNQTIVFTISNFADELDKETAAQAQADFINALASTNEGFVVVARDKTGVRRFYGVTNPLFATVMQKTSGAVTTDVAGTTITLSEAQSVPAPAIDFAFGATGLISGK